MGWGPSHSLAPSSLFLLRASSNDVVSRWAFPGWTTHSVPRALCLWFLLVRTWVLPSLLTKTWEHGVPMLSPTLCENPSSLFFRQNPSNPLTFLQRYFRNFNSLQLSAEQVWSNQLGLDLKRQHGCRGFHLTNVWQYGLHVEVVHGEGTGWTQATG